jgi:hypothetical protein
MGGKNRCPDSGHYKFHGAYCESRGVCPNCSENMVAKFGNPNLEAPFPRHDFKSRVEPLGGQNELDFTTERPKYHFCNVL